ncbi:hypothetical protein Plhal703r1_c12g0060981 [Plasmopara halstedii]
MQSSFPIFNEDEICRPRHMIALFCLIAKSQFTATCTAELCLRRQPKPLLSPSYNSMNCARALDIVTASKKLLPTKRGGVMSY